MRWRRPLKHFCVYALKGAYNRTMHWPFLHTHTRSRKLHTHIHTHTHTRGARTHTHTPWYHLPEGMLTNTQKVWKQIQAKRTKLRITGTSSHSLHLNLIWQYFATHICGRLIQAHSPKTYRDLLKQHQHKIKPAMFNHSRLWPPDPSTVPNEGVINIMMYNCVLTHRIAMLGWSHTHTHTRPGLLLAHNVLEHIERNVRFRSSSHQVGTLVWWHVLWSAPSRP